MGCYYEKPSTSEVETVGADDIFHANPQTYLREQIWGGQQPNELGDPTHNLYMTPRCDLMSFGMVSSLSSLIDGT
jgi:hypothetical protein